jgi:hypothetical protein
MHHGVQSIDRNRPKAVQKARPWEQAHRAEAGRCIWYAPSADEAATIVGSTIEANKCN